MKTSATMTEQEARAEYWRLQWELDSMSQDEAEGPKGERLLARQMECHRQVAEATGDEFWSERSFAVA